MLPAADAEGWPWAGGASGEGGTRATEQRDSDSGDSDSDSGGGAKCRRVDALRLPSPVIVLGMPKAGTSSLEAYFRGGGRYPSHFACDNHFSEAGPSAGPAAADPSMEAVPPLPWRNCRLPAAAGPGAFQGLRADEGGFPLCAVCVERNVLRGRPPLEGCGRYDVWTELDSAEHPLPSSLGGGEGGGDDSDGDGSATAAAAAAAAGAAPGLRPLCSYPQVTRLEEIHAAYPEATFVLNVRPTDHWVRSVGRWNGAEGRTGDGYLRRVLTECDLPGLPPGAGSRDGELASFYEGHSRRVREFAALHPGHALVEVDVEATDAGRVLEEAFGISAGCWGLTNGSSSRGDGVEKAGGGNERAGGGGGPRRAAAEARVLLLRGDQVGRDGDGDGDGDGDDDGAARQGPRPLPRPKRSPLRRAGGGTGEGEGEGEDPGGGGRLGPRGGAREALREALREKRERRRHALSDRRNYPVCEDVGDILPPR